MEKKIRNKKENNLFFLFSSHLIKIPDFYSCITVKYFSAFKRKTMLFILFK